MRIPWPAGKKRQAIAYATYELKSVPNRKIDVAELFTRKMRFPFAVFYDFLNMKTYAVIPEEQSGFFESIARSTIGLEFERVGGLSEEVGKEAWCCVGFPSEREALTNDPFSRDVPGEKAEGMPLVSEFFNSFRKKDCKLLVSFIPAPVEELDRERSNFEKKLSKEHGVSVERGVHYPDIAFGTRRSSSSANQFVYKGTDETQLAAEIVSMCNNAKNLNDGVFRVSVSGWGKESGHLKNQLLPKLLHIEEQIDRNDGIGKCFPQERPAGEIMSGRYASKFISFSRECAEEKIVVEVPPVPSHGLKQGTLIGRELVCGVDDCGREINFSYFSLNRHCSVTGQQGSGKTTVAMALTLPILKAGKPVIVITPSNEWSKLGGASEKILIVDIASSPMNLVRCPESVPADVYYQNLALQMSNTMHAGPYTIPLRRTLLRAFRELYAEKREPSLEEVYLKVYGAIEEIYGTESKGGVRFDKYGQNLSASLENLKELMQKENFTGHGILIEDCIARGAVFDLSGISKLLRPLIYSFLLSQIFSYSSQKFDEHGENDFRLLLILEEAHLVFKKYSSDDGSREVVEELENELGAFRKRGIGLMFITHYSDQLSEGIWRHAQNHFVFKQDAIGAKLSIDQLAFDKSDHSLIASAQAKISKLDLGDCCCLLTDKSRQTIGPFFMHVEPKELGLLEKEEIENRLGGYLKTVKAPERVDLDSRYVTENDEKFLEDIHLHKFSGLSSRYKRLNVHPGKGAKIRDGLIKKGLVEECLITVGRKNFVFLVLTEAGVGVLKGMDKVGLEFWTEANESFKHKLFQNAVKNAFIADGWDAIVEQPRPKGGFVDVAVYDKDRSNSIAIEVTLRPDNIVENVRKDLEAGFKEVRIIYEHEKVEEQCLKALREVFPELLSGEILFRPIEFFKEHIAE